MRYSRVPPATSSAPRTLRSAVLEPLHPLLGSVPVGALTPVDEHALARTSVTSAAVILIPNEGTANGASFQQRRPMTSACGEPAVVRRHRTDQKSLAGCWRLALGCARNRLELGCLQTTG